MTAQQRTAIQYIKEATTDQEKQSRMRCLNYQTYGSLKRQGYIIYSVERGYELTAKAEKVN